MDKEFYQQRKATFSKGRIEYVNEAGIVAEVMEERHVRFRLPVEKGHLNHVGTVYAGSMFVLAEVAGGNLFVCTYDQSMFVPIVKSVEIKYLKPSKKDLIVDIRLSEEEAAEKIKAAEARGRGDYFLEIPVFDTDGVLVAQTSFNYYAIAPTNDFAGK